MKMIALVLFLTSTCFLAADCGCGKKVSSNTPQKKQQAGRHAERQSPKAIKRVPKQTP